MGRFSDIGFGTDRRGYCLKLTGLRCVALIDAVRNMDRIKVTSHDVPLIDAGKRLIRYSALAASVFSHFRSNKKMPHLIRSCITLAPVMTTPARMPPPLFGDQR
jgi:hypothetical protein